MKINLEIELPWIDDEHDVDEAVKAAVVRRIADQAHKGIKENIKRKAAKRISILLDEWIMEQLNSFCDRRIAVTDKWGDTIEHHESVTEMFKTKFDEFFNASVNEKGETLKSCSYGTRTTRIDYMLQKKAEAHLSSITKNMDRSIAAAINDATKKQIEETIKKHVLDKVTDFVK